jgi:catechol 2,3-dioxygenase-like lactoylglutathione lyase family enzyme
MLPRMKRRDFLYQTAVAGLAGALRTSRAVAAPDFRQATLLAQAKPQILVKALNHFTLQVSDIKRSVDFYQHLFGMPIQARQGPTVILRIGNGPQFVALSAAGSNPPNINHLCMTVENFNVDRIIGVLAQHGVVRNDAGGPMTVRVRMRGPEAGGEKEGTPELYIGDPDGLVVQLQDTTYCGGAGVLGNVCLTKPEPAPKNGLLAVTDISHFTNSAADANRSNQFYQELFGLRVRSKQGASLGLGVGPGVGFLMFTGGVRAAVGRGTASIHHVCMNMEAFNVDAILKTLASFGISARGDAPGPVGPMKSYVTMRMPNRGGAPEGTPELYFTDPDGLLIQLQHVSYCGGGGDLGNEQCA